jgi:hypothetical protein
MFTVIWLKDTAERVLRTVLQAVIAAVVLSGPFNLTAAKSVLFVALTAGLTVVKDALAELVSGTASPASFAPTADWFLDAFERLAATFVIAFVSALLVGGSYDISAGKQAALAGVAAVGSLLMSLVASVLHPTISPASFVEQTSAVSGSHRASARTRHGAAARHADEPDVRHHRP